MNTKTRNIDVVNVEQEEIKEAIVEYNRLLDYHSARNARLEKLSKRKHKKSDAKTARNILRKETSSAVESQIETIIEVLTAKLS